MGPVRRINITIFIVKISNQQNGPICGGLVKNFTQLLLVKNFTQLLLVKRKNFLKKY
jgi:hypothetical protein